MNLEVIKFAQTYLSLTNDWNLTIEKTGINPYNDWTNEDWIDWYEVMNKYEEYE